MTEGLFAKYRPTPEPATPVANGRKEVGSPRILTTFEIAASDAAEEAAAKAAGRPTPSEVRAILLEGIEATANAVNEADVAHAEWEASMTATREAQFRDGQQRQAEENARAAKYTAERLRIAAEKAERDAAIREAKARESKARREDAAS